MPSSLSAGKNTRQTALDNEFKVLMAVRRFGHLRASEVGRAVWPHSRELTARAMADLTLKRMVAKSLLLKKPNSYGGASFLLSPAGCRHLRDADVSATEGYKLSPAGPQFFHRTLGTNYLLDKQQAGFEVYGEYALLKGYAPVDLEYLRKKHGKLPDGLVVYAPEQAGTVGGVLLADWVEVESNFKDYDDVEHAFRLLLRSGELTQAGNLLLNKLVFVYDARQTHEARLKKYAARFLRENPGLSASVFLDAVTMARCTIGYPLKWGGAAESSLASMMKVPA